MKKIKFNIKGMHCQACSKLIESELKERPGVKTVKVNHETGKAVLVVDESEINISEIKQAVSEAGEYTAEEMNADDDDKVNHEKKKANKTGKLDTIDIFFRVIMTLIALAVLVIIIVYASRGNTDKTVSINTKADKKVAVNQPNSPSPSAPARTEAVIDIKINKDDHVRGKSDAPVTIVEFSDFQCPYCSRFHSTMKQVFADYPDQIRWVYKHFPLDSIHPFARKAAVASECAAEQGKFWEYADSLFTSTQGLGEDALKSMANLIGLNTKKFAACLESDKYADKVEANQQEGIKYGVRGTPGNIVNGQLMSGALGYDTIKSIIEKELSK